MCVHTYLVAFQAFQVDSCLVCESLSVDHVSEINAALEQSRGNLARAEGDKEDMRHEIAQLKVRFELFLLVLELCQNQLFSQPFTQEQLQGASLSLENASYLENELELREKQYKEVQEKGLWVEGAILYMPMYACICVCMYLCMHVCTCVHM